MTITFRASRAMVAVVAFATGCADESACPSARRDTLHVLVDELAEHRTKQEGLRSARRDVEAQGSKLLYRREVFDGAVRLFEQSMDCLVRTDCCDRMAKRTEMVRMVPSFALSVRDESEKLPDEVKAGVAPLLDAMAVHDFLVSGAPTAKEITAWCTSVRQQIGSVRGTLPVAWKRALDSNAAELERAVATLQASDAREQELLAQYKLVARTEPVPGIVAGPDDDRADQQVLAYQAACH